jgi:glutathione S-transferase
METGGPERFERRCRERRNRHRKETGMIVVHHLENSRSHRILWMLEELGVPYEIKHYKREPTLQAPASLRQVHPLGKSPVITDGGRTIAESGAILEYLVETYGQGRFVPPAGSEERQHYRYFMHYAEGSLMPLLVMKVIFNRMLPARAPFLIRPVARAIAKGADQGYLEPQIGNHFTFLESELGQREWFAGKEFTAADVQMSYPLDAAAARAPQFKRFARLVSFVERIHARPAYQRAQERGGKQEVLR